MRILHTGDFHLDSPFAGLDISRGERRRRETRETFSKMMRYAGEQGVDMVIICGDLFDSDFVTRETVALLISEFSALSCPVIIVPGNHDPCVEGSVWEKTVFPKNVHVFKSGSLEKLTFDELGACVYGYGFTSRSIGECLVSGSVEDPERINILAAHADIMSPISKYAPLPVSVIRAFGADYCALGHIHNTDAANEALGSLGAYCGCPEGRDFGEIGEKGAIVAEVEKGYTKRSLVRFSKRTYHTFELNIDGCEDMTSAGAAIDSFIAGCGADKESLVRIVLTGAVSPSLVINTSLLSEDTRGLFHLEVQDSTSPTWKGELLLTDKGIRGELYRTLLPDLESEDAEKRKTAALALRYALAALRGEDITDA